MSKLIVHLANYLTEELISAINFSPNDSLRVVFSAPPQKQLSALFEYITQENNCLVLDVKHGIVNVPVYLVDKDAADPVNNPTAARCTQSYLVTIRNSNAPTFLALQDVGASSNQSLSSAVKPLGISKEMPNFEGWLESKVVQYLLREYRRGASISTSKTKQLDSGLEHALAKAWEVDERNKDKKTAWDLLETLFDVSIDQEEPHSVFAASLGLTSCSESEFCGADHLGLVEQIAEHFDSFGFRSGFEEFENNADKRVLPYVQEFRGHLERQGIIEANEFSRNPLYFYSPIKNGVTDIPRWWYELNAECWAVLLGGTGSTEPAKSSLEVKILNELLGVPKGLLPIVYTSVQLEIANKLESPVEVQVERASGNAALVEVSRITIDSNSEYALENSDIPPHERFVRYKISTKDQPPIFLKVVVLDFYGPKLIAFSPSSSKATPFKLNKKAKDENNKTISRYECDLKLRGMGSHTLNLYKAKDVTLDQKIRGYGVDAEDSDVLERTVTEITDNHYSCLVETDEECYYDISCVSPENDETFPYRIHIEADDTRQSGAISEFDRLVTINRSSATGTHASPRVEPLNCRTMELEIWALESDRSYRPLLMGPDYLECWSKPNWGLLNKFSNMSMLVDPRPPADEMNAPSEFVEARSRVLNRIREPHVGVIPPASVLKLHELMRDDAFVDLVKELLNAYLAWLENDYENAVWSDLVSLHSRQSNSAALGAVPYAILLSPYHPIKLAWQCCAQEVLQKALDTHLLCPAASVMNPTSFPDCLMLPCRTATGSIDRKPFVAMDCSSDYWGVMWSIEGGAQDSMSKDSIFNHVLGIHVAGLSSGFNAQQVVRSLDEVTRLKSAKSTFRVGLSSDDGGSISCNDGIDIWCSSNLGVEEDVWHHAGPRSLVITDQRDESLHPEQAKLASLTSKTHAAVRWFTKGSDHSDQKDDLSIIAQLGTMNRGFDVQNTRSAIDASALTRWRVRKQIPNKNGVFIAESRIGNIPSNLDHESVSGKLLCCVDLIERQCRDNFDSYVFAPDMAQLSKVVERSHYTALSSSGIDAACFFGATDKAYLWDYELPSYAQRAGENSGYYLLGTESPGMLQAVRSALGLLNDSRELDDGSISSLLQEISRRGMPTLKRLTAGGSMSFGELGMLTALRILQSEFESSPSESGLLPALDTDETINIVISADPFQKHFDDLRAAIKFKEGERPDLLVISIKFASGEPVKMRLTPVEIKARGGSLSPKERVSALKQASSFSSFLSTVQERSNESELWGIAWRNLLGTLLDYGFRVYGQLDQFIQQKDWSEQHSLILRSIAAGELEIDLDMRGRLIAIDNSNMQVSQLDTDGDGFYETIRLTHAEAFSVLENSGGKFSRNVNTTLGNWEFKPEVDDIYRSRADDANRTSEEPLGSPDEESGVLPVKGHETDSSKHTIESHSTMSSSKDANNIEAVDTTDSTGIKFTIGETISQFTPQKLEFFPSSTELTHLNVGIVGDLGTGKTQLIQALVKQICGDASMNRGTRPNILIFDYKKDYSKPAFVEATGARVVSPFDIPLNLFDVRDSNLSEKRAINERFKFFADVMDKIYSGIGAVQRVRIKTAVKEAYKNSEMNGAIAPTISDVFDAYKDTDNKPDTPYTIMDDLVDGEYFVSDSAEVIPFSEFLDGVVVIDLAEVGQDDKTKNMLVVIFLNMFYEHMLRIEKKDFVGKDPQLRFIDSMLLVDEATNIMKYEFDVLQKVLLQGREFGVGVLLASQYLSHFKTSHENYLENLLTWFVLKVPNVTVRELEAIGLTGVDSSVIDTIKSLKCHECLYKTFSVNGKIVRATPFYELMKLEMAGETEN